MVSANKMSGCIKSFAPHICPAQCSVLFNHESPLILTTVLTMLLFSTGAGSGGANFSVNPSFQFGGSETLNKWLSPDNSKMEINSLIDDNILPVNSVDIESQTLLCGTDSESIITIRLPSMR